MPYPTRKKAAPDEDLVNDGTGIGGEGYYPMDEVGEGEEPIPHDEPDADDLADAPEMKPGALALTELYEHLMDLGEVIERLSAAQEHPEVSRALDKFASDLDRNLDACLGTFKRLYPELPEPGPGEVPEEMTKGEDGLSEEDGEDGGYTVDEKGFGDDEDEEGEEEEDEDAPPAMSKAAQRRRRFLKRLDLARQWRALVRLKRHAADPKAVIRKAAEHLEEVGDHDGDWTQVHKSACHYHAKGLRRVCKSFTTAGSGTQEDLARSGIEAVKKSYDARINGLVGQIERLGRELQKAREGR